MGFWGQPSFRALRKCVHLRCLTPTCARLQGEAVNLLAVHPCGPVHARRKVKAELRN